jgi:thioredoxin-dependent peroxiredoxin
MQMKKTTKKATKKTTKKVATKKSVSKKATKKVAKKVLKKSPKKVTKKVATKKATTKVVATKSALPAAKVLPVPAIGSQAPSFTLLNEQGNAVSLEDFRGKKVVIYFYPRAMTPGCTTQACGLRDMKAELAKRNIVVLGVSPDKFTVLQKFIDKEKLNFTLLSDVELTVARAYGAFGRKSFMGRTFDGILRQSYLIDEGGKILHVITKVDTKTHAQDVIAHFEK